MERRPCLCRFRGGVDEFAVRRTIRTSTKRGSFRSSGGTRIFARKTMGSSAGKLAVVTFSMPPPKTLNFASPNRFALSAKKP